MRLLLVVATALSLAACMVRRDYLLDDAALAKWTATPAEERARLVLPALRTTGTCATKVEQRCRVQIDASSLRLPATGGMGNHDHRIATQRHSPRLTSAAVLAGVAATLFIASGALVGYADNVTSNDAGVYLAVERDLVAGNALLIAGGVTLLVAGGLAVFGWWRPPQEVAAPRAPSN